MEADRARAQRVHDFVMRDNGAKHRILRYGRVDFGNYTPVWDFLLPPAGGLSRASGGLSRAL